jgi:tRNA(Ser,Leu) C12 N-acetylase TAN1
MICWNVVIDIHDHSFSRAYLLFEEFGTVFQSDFEDILLMKVDSIPGFLKTFNTQVLADPSLAKVASRIVPVTSTFSFESPEEFETKAKKVVLNWLPKLEGKKFYVRMYRKGMKDRIDRHEEETFLDLVILQELEKIGKPGQISVVDPDILVAVETVSHQAGLSYWSRQDLQNYPWLKLTELSTINK